MERPDPPVKKTRAPRKPAAARKPAPAAESGESLALILAVDTLRSASVIVHQLNQHGGAYVDCRDSICSKANVLWEHVGGTHEVQRLISMAEDWLVENVRLAALPPEPKIEGPEFRKTKETFDGELAPGAPPMVIADVTESRRDPDDPGIPKEMKKIDPNKPPA